MGTKVYCLEGMILDMFDGRYSGDSLMLNNHGIEYDGAYFSDDDGLHKALRSDMQKEIRFVDRNVNPSGHGFAVCCEDKADGSVFAGMRIDFEFESDDNRNAILKIKKFTSPKVKFDIERDIFVEA